MEQKANELETLVKKVTCEVLNRIMMQPVNEAGRIGNGFKSGHRLLVLVPRYAINLPEYLEYLSCKHPQSILMLGCMGGVSKSFREMKQVEKIVDISDEGSLQGILDGFSTFEAVYCISPGIKLLENITQYNDTGFIENILVQSLLCQKPAGILMDYDAQRLSGGISKKVRELTSAITDMGITVEKVCKEENGSADQPVKGKGSELITEKDIDEMSKKGIKEISSSKGCIITPLARDRAKEVGINIK